MIFGKHRFENRNISATIAADVKRFCHQIKRTTFSAHTPCVRPDADGRRREMGPILGDRGGSLADTRWEGLNARAHQVGLDLLELGR
jgi:hypothetical protein